MDVDPRYPGVLAAVRAGDAARVRDLVSTLGMPEVNPFYADPLAVAVRMQRWDVGDDLLAMAGEQFGRATPAFRDFSNRALIDIASRNDWVGLRYMERAGGNIDGMKHSMFVWSAVDGHLEMADAFLAMGADVHTRISTCPYSDTALFYAVCAAKEREVAWLLERGADAHANDDKAMEVAAQRGYWRVHELLANH